MLDAQQVQGFADDEIDEVVDGLGFEIEPGVGRGDDRASEGQGAHVFDVDEVQRGFAVAHNQSSAFFEGDGGGAGEQV